MVGSVFCPVLNTDSLSYVFMYLNWMQAGASEALSKWIMFSRMETVYKLLYSLIGVQWKCYNMIAERNLLHFLMEREEVRHSLSEVQAVLWLVELWVHGVGKPALLCMPWRQRQRNLVKQHLRLDLGLDSIRNILKHIRIILGVHSHDMYHLCLRHRPCDVQ